MARRRNSSEQGGSFEIPEPDDEEVERIEREVDETLGEIAAEEATDPVAGSVVVACGRRNFDVSLMVTPVNPRKYPGAPLGGAQYHISGPGGTWGGKLAHAGSPIGAMLKKAGIGGSLSISVEVKPKSAVLDFVAFVGRMPAASALFWFPGVAYRRHDPVGAVDQYAKDEMEDGRLTIETAYSIHDFVVGLAVVELVKRIAVWPGSPLRSIDVIDWTPGGRGNSDILPHGWVI